MEHYEEIKKANPNKPDEWIFKVYIQENGKYKIKESRAHIKSYEFVQMISSDIPFSFEELENIPTSLYDLSKCDIKDISAYTEKKFHNECTKSQAPRAKRSKTT